MVSTLVDKQIVTSGIMHGMVSSHDTSPSIIPVEHGVVFILFSDSVLTCRVIACGSDSILPHHGGSEEDVPAFCGF